MGGVSLLDILQTMLNLCWPWDNGQIILYFCKFISAKFKHLLLRMAQFKNSILCWIYLFNTFNTEKSRIIFRFIFSCENFNNFFFCCCGKIIQQTVSSISNRESTKRGSDCLTVWLAEQVSDQTLLNFLSSIIQKVKNVLSVLSFLFIKTSSSFFILLFIFV